MNMTSFWNEVELRLRKFDLLTHPFYQAWSEGLLSPQDLRMYAAQYYEHVRAFPEYLEALENRLPVGTLRNTIADNRADELSDPSCNGRSHSDLWLDFASAMGADEKEVESCQRVSGMENLIEHFRGVAETAAPVEALAAFFAYESQVPRIAKEKAIGLKQRYGADAKAYKYFSVHTHADVEHANTWKALIEAELSQAPVDREKALAAVETTAERLWQALDGIEEKRLAAGGKAVCCH